MVGVTPVVMQGIATNHAESVVRTPVTVHGTSMNHAEGVVR
jgi:hypothetical protein